jgi:hypothetical protein
LSSRVAFTLWALWPVPIDSLGGGSPHVRATNVLQSAATVTRITLHIVCQCGTGLGPTQWVLRALSTGLIADEREAYNPPPSSVEAQNAWSFTSALSVRLHCRMLRLCNNFVPFMRFERQQIAWINPCQVFDISFVRVQTGRLHFVSSALSHSCTSLL